MKANKLLAGKFLKAADIGDVGAKVKFTISHVEPEYAFDKEDGTTQKKCVLHFKETDQLMPLNNTNIEALMEFVGDDTDDWTGATIEVEVQKVQFGAKRVPGMRITSNSGAPF